MKNWYVVNTRPRQECVAELHLMQLGVEVFSPECRENRVIRRKRQTVSFSLFPGYIFARFEVSSHYRAVHYAHGVRGIVQYGSDPAEMDESVITLIKSKIEDGHVVLRPPAFSAGQTVRIQTGTFEGLEAVFQREMTAQNRVVLLLNTLMYQPQVVIDREYIEAL